MPTEAASSEALPDTLNSHWKNDTTRFGYKMLAKYGWTEEKGLGKDETGNTVAVKVSRREEGLGIGMELEVDKSGNGGWSKNVDGLNEVLGMLREQYRPKTDGSSKDTKTKKTKKRTTIVHAGMKYKRHQIAKDITSKSDADKRAIFGSAFVKIDYSSVCEEEVDQRV